MKNAIHIHKAIVKDMTEEEIMHIADVATMIHHKYPREVIMKVIKMDNQVARKDFMRLLNKYINAGFIKFSEISEEKYLELNTSKN